MCHIRLCFDLTFTSPCNMLVLDNRVAFSYRSVRAYSQTKANFPFSCDSFLWRLANGSEYPQTVLKLSFGITKMVAYANKVYVYLFVTKNIRKFIALILFTCFYINNY